MKYPFLVGLVAGLIWLLIGIAFGVLTGSEIGKLAVRAAGGVIALVGAAFLFGVA